MEIINSSPYALRPTLYALRPTLYALRPTLYALRPTLSAFIGPFQSIFNTLCVNGGDTDHVDDFIYTAANLQDVNRFVQTIDHRSYNLYACNGLKKLIGDVSGCQVWEYHDICRAVDQL